MRIEGVDDWLATTEVTGDDGVALELTLTLLPGKFSTNCTSYT